MANATRSWTNISLLYSIRSFKKQRSFSQRLGPLLRHQKTFYFYSSKHKDPQIQSRKLLINPDGHFKLFLNICSLILITFQSLFIPFWIVYQTEIDTWMIYGPQLYFLFQMLAKLNTAYYKKGALIKNRLQMLQKYLLSEFKFDFIALFPIIQILQKTDWIQNFPQNQIKFFLVLKLLRLFNLNRIFDQIQRQFSWSLLVTALSLVKFMLVAIYAIHWLNCINQLVYLQSIEYEENYWKYFNQEIFSRYVQDLQYTFVTMTSVGYGNFVYNSSPYQQITAILTMISACALLGFLHGQIQLIINKTNLQQKEFKQIVDQFKFYSKHKKLSKGTLQRALMYLHFMNNSKLLHKTTDDKALGTLSACLLQEIYIVTRGQLISHCVPFQHYSVEFIKQIGKFLRLEIYSPGDMVFQQNQASTKVYFIHAGCVSIYHQKSKTVFRDYKKGKSFGEIGFFLGKKRCASVKCLLFSEVLTLSRFAFLDMLKSKPKEKEITNQMIENCQILDLSILGIRCFLCRKMGHVAPSCKVYKIGLNRKAISDFFIKNRQRKGLNLIQPNFDLEQSKRKSKKINPNYSLNNCISPKFPYNFRSESLLKKIKFFKKKYYGRMPCWLDVIKQESEKEEQRLPSLNWQHRFSQRFVQSKKFKALKRRFQPMFIKNHQVLQTNQENKNFQNQQVKKMSFIGHSPSKFRQSRIYPSSFSILETKSADPLSPV